MKKITNYFVGLSFALGMIAFVAAPALASAETFLTRQLQQGMSGADVSSLQSFLAKDATIYPQGLVTGYFGTLTASAVSNFQARNGIATVGRVGPVTMAAINAQMNGDNRSPAINSLNVNPSNTTANLNWNTNESSAGIVYYATSPLSMIEGSPTTGVTIGGSSLLVNTYLQSSFSANLTNLNPNTTYYYVVYVRDSSGNESITWPSTFHTNQ
jgi:peptidoglycan hydrolase-like protein with peptidoglycan-binding domain